MPQQKQDEKDKSDRLIKDLIEQRLISAPQADMARADVEATGMTIDEVLIARRWVSEETIYKLAPWLKDVAPAAPAENSSTSASVDPAALESSDDFDENLRKYRLLMNRILGEASQ